MIETIRALIVKYWDILSYLFFGGLTTLVNFLVYYPLFNWTDLPGVVCNVIAWAISVIFAYLTNKPFVFRSKDWSCKTVILEAAKFVGCRLGSGLLETVFIWLTVDMLHWNGNVMKLIVSVLVVILNYVGSKLIVFKNKKEA